MGSVRVVFYSATGNTRKIAESIGETVSWHMGMPVSYSDYSRPDVRKIQISLDVDDILVFCTPVYRGELPPYIFDDIGSKLKGSGGYAICAMTYGNRAVDNAFADMVQTVRDLGFVPVSAVSFPCRHCYTDVLAGDRPNGDDLSCARRFAERSCGLIREGIGERTLTVPGVAGGPAYVPLGADGNPISFHDAVPVTDMSICTGCGKCAELCPLGSIDASDVFVLKGPCFKCQACVRGCPEGAKRFTDERFVSHVRQIESRFADRKEIKTYFA